MTETEIRIKNLFRKKQIRTQTLLLTCQPNIFYFTGFTGDDSWAIISPKRTIILTDGRYELQAHQQCPTAKIVIRTGAMTKEFAKVIKKHKIQSLAIVAEEISLALMSKIKKSCAELKIKRISDHIISDSRQIKSQSELKAIKKAIVIAEKSFLESIKQIKAGMSERKLAALLEYKMKTNGAEKSAFDIIVACGKNAAKPHAETSNAKLKPNQPIVIDFGARYKGYCSDLTRTIWLGKMPERFKRLYGICLDAQLAAIAAVRAGIEVAEVDKQARDIIESAGYGKYFNHSVGHGIGLEVHEGPVLSQRIKQKLEAGMVITVEPGIYIPGKGGIRIEDNVLVTEQGFKVLSTLPKQINEVIF